MLSIAGQWSRGCCLVLATGLLRGCWVSSCTGGRGQTSDTCTGTSSLSTEHSLDNVWYLHDEPGHAQPRVQALVAVQLLAAPPRRASSLEISRHCSSALCFVFNCLNEALSLFSVSPRVCRGLCPRSPCPSRSRWRPAGWRWRWRLQELISAEDRGHASTLHSRLATHRRDAAQCRCRSWRHCSHSSSSPTPSHPQTSCGENGEIIWLMKNEDIWLTD